MSNNKKFFNNGKTKADNKVEPSTTTSRDFGYVVPGKGGKTLNASINPHSFEKECEMIGKEDYVPEHERYLGVGMEAVK